MEHTAVRLGRMLFVAFSVLLLLSMAGCESEDGSIPVVIPGITSDPIYNADGGFVITQGMLSKPYNQVTFPATHNSFAGPNWHDACANQRINIAAQLRNGIRHIELDVDADGCASHNGFCKRPLNQLLVDIKEYARLHPKQVITVRISDLACDRRDKPCKYITAPNDEVDLDNTSMKCKQAAPTPDGSFHLMNAKLEATGLSAYIYNWDGSITDNSDPAKCYVPVQWPTLGEMINSQKNVMFFHHRDVHDIVDSGYFRGLDFTDYNSQARDGYASYQLADLSKIQSVWDPGLCDRQKDGYDRLFLLECHAATYKACGVGQFWSTGYYGCPKSHRACNDGRRQYQLAKQHEEDPLLLPGDRVTNFISVDYYMCTQDETGTFVEPVSVVDACNRLNYERFGSDWSGSMYAWELQPHEFDGSKVEHIQQVAKLRAEVDEAISDFQLTENGLFGHRARGAIVSTDVYQQVSLSENGDGSLTDWYWVPEWAVDNDFYTAWRGSGADWSGSLVIDLRSRKPIDEIAIAWKYSHKAPGYKVYASNDDAVMKAPPASTAGWTQVAMRNARWLSPPRPWDSIMLPLFNWRYIKIELTDSGPNWGSAIFEMRVFGPAS